MEDTKTRSEKRIHSHELSAGGTLHDNVYDERVEVAATYVGKVCLRYPHQTKKHLYEHECGKVFVGMDELADHAQDCDEGNPDWWDDENQDPENLAEMEENGEVPYKRIEDDDRHIESYSYSWPLDGHRFTIES